MHIQQDDLKAQIIVIINFQHFRHNIKVAIHLRKAKDQILKMISNKKFKNSCRSIKNINLTKYVFVKIVFMQINFIVTKL
jgi:hypothetical protein